MNDLWQYIVVGIVVAIAFLLAARSVYRAMTHKKSALVSCDSCKLKDACTKKGQSSKDCQEIQKEKE